MGKQVAEQLQVNIQLQVILHSKDLVIVGMMQSCVENAFCRQINSRARMQSEGMQLR